MNKIYLLLILIIILASFLRIFKIDSAPSSLTWDEAAVGYNAFVIANYGKDEYGKSFPLYFQSFGEDKQPIHIYITAIFVKLFGLNEFTTRLPAAIFGILDVFLSTISYHAAEIAVPLICLLIAVLYFKQLKQNKYNLIISFILITGLLIFSFFQPRLFGINRFSQTVQGKIDIEQTEIFKSTHNYLLGRINLVLVQYLSHFHPKFLFISGDENPRLSSQGAGEFYIIDSLFIILGIFYLIKRRSKENLLLLGWGLIGPLPSALFVPAPHVGRTVFMMAGWHLIAAIGTYTVASFGKFYFAGWDPVVSMPNKEVLYVLTPSQYDGLMYRSSFNVKKVIYYPNNTTAFFIVSIT